jgi:hypothetical protein
MWATLRSARSERGVAAGEEIRIGFVMREDARAAEEAGEDDVAAGRIGGAGGEQVGRDDAEQGAEFEDVPALFAEDGDG